MSHRLYLVRIYATQDAASLLVSPLVAAQQNHCGAILGEYLCSRTIERMDNYSVWIMRSVDTQLVPRINSTATAGTCTNQDHHNSDFT